MERVRAAAVHGKRSVYLIDNEFVKWINIARPLTSNPIPPSALSSSYRPPFYEENRRDDSSSSSRLRFLCFRRPDDMYRAEKNMLNAVHAPEYFGEISRPTGTSVRCNTNGLSSSRSLGKVSRD